VFRGIDRWGTLESTALSPQAVNLILKKRARLAGLEVVEFTASLRWRDRPSKTHRGSRGAHGAALGHQDARGKRRFQR
jgi:hypothetical protein